MRDNKISLLLLASFLLLLASFLVLCTWGYNFYTKVEKVTAKLNPEKIPEKNITAGRDSLLALYTQTIQRFDDKLSVTFSNADSLEQDLQFKLDEYYRVKNELAGILKNPASALTNDLAKNKIVELQQKIRQLETTNINVTEENKKLYALLEQLKRENKTQTSLPSSPNIVATTSSFAQSTKFSEALKNVDANAPIAFAVSDLDLYPINGDNDNEDISGIQGSFVVKSMSNNSGEIMIVVTQPNGKVLQKSTWESGTFNSRDGKKIYTCKMYLENAKGEAKRLSFSINNDKTLKGNYTFQIYHNGQSLAKITKNVS